MLQIGLRICKNLWYLITSARCKWVSGLGKNWCNVVTSTSYKFGSDLEQVCVMRSQVVNTKWGSRSEDCYNQKENGSVFTERWSNAERHRCNFCLLINWMKDCYVESSSHLTHLWASSISRVLWPQTVDGLISGTFYDPGLSFGQLSSRTVLPILAGGQYLNTDLPSMFLAGRGPLQMLTWTQLGVERWI